MTLSNAFLEICYMTLVQKSKTDYRGYTVKWMIRNQELRFLKSNRKLASWFLESNTIEVYESGENPAEHRMTKQFELLPQELEGFFQRKKVQQEERKEVEIKQEQDVQPRFLRDLNARCLQLRDDEVSNESIDKIISDLAIKYIDEWYCVGIHPDRYADNFPMYFSFARADVRSALSEVEDKRIREHLLRISGESLIPPSLKSTIENLTDEEIIEKTQVIPIRAQREGNLVKITELEDNRFEKLTVGAIEFAKEMVSKKIREYVLENQIEVFWWEKDAKYFLPPLEKGQKQEIPRTFREMILGSSSSSKDSKSKSKAKPSRIRLEIRFFYNDDVIHISKYKPQRGVISWSNNFNQ